MAQLTPTQYLDNMLQRLDRNPGIQEKNFANDLMRANHMLSMAIEGFDQVERQVGASRMIAMWRIFKNGVENSGEYNEWMEYVNGELLPDPEREPDEASKEDAQTRRREILKWAHVVDVILSWLKTNTVMSSAGNPIDTEVLLNRPGVSQKLRNSVKVFRDAKPTQRERIILVIYEGTQADVIAMRDKIIKENEPENPNKPTPTMYTGTKVLLDDGEHVRYVIEIAVKDAPAAELLLTSLVKFDTSTVDPTGASTDASVPPDGGDSQDEGATPVSGVDEEAAQQAQEFAPMIGDEGGENAL